MNKKIAFKCSYKFLIRNKLIWNTFYKNTLQNYNNNVYVLNKEQEIFYRKIQVNKNKLFGF